MDPLAQTRTEIHGLKREVRIRTIAIIGGVILIVLSVLGFGLRFNNVADNAEAGAESADNAAKDAKSAAESARQAAETAAGTSADNNRILKLIEGALDPSSESQQRSQDVVRRLYCYEAKIHNAAPPADVTCKPEEL